MHTPHPSPIELGKGSFTRAGATIHYWAAGKPDAPVVICTHGVTIDHGTFAEQIPALVAAGYRAIVWDLRGHGLSRPAGKRISYVAAAADLAMLLEETAVDRAVLVGQSFGGMIVQEFCRHHADRAAGLVLVGSPLLGDQLPWPHRWLQRTRPLLLRLWPEGHLRRITPQFMSQYRAVQQYVAKAIQPLAKEDFVQVTEAALEVFLNAKPLPKSNTPVLLVRGEGEMAMLTQMMDRLATNEPQVQLAIVPDAGHLANHDNPAAFNEVLLAFLPTALRQSKSRNLRQVS
jgi:3-oxoadipate enol-lactonase